MGKCTFHDLIGGVFSAITACAQEYAQAHDRGQPWKAQRMHLDAISETTATIRAFCDEIDVEACRVMKARALQQNEIGERRQLWQTANNLLSCTEHSNAVDFGDDGGSDGLRRGSRTGATG